MNVTIFNAGWMTAARGLWRQGEEEPERPIKVPVPVYLIEIGSQRILVDTGLHPGAVADSAGHYGEGTAIGFFKLEQERSVADQIDLDTVSMLVLTHLHFDHAGGLALIPDSVPVVVQRAEWEASQDPEAIARNFFLPHDYADAPVDITLIDGDHDLLGDGSVMLLSTPGHTPGHQSVQVGDLVIGADVAHYAHTFDDLQFPSFAADFDAQRNSAERLRSLRDEGLTVLPGHDADVLQPGPIKAS
jgi:glyoxylase-like metal-dependent hydrolase (beta-lactamase superfamily II)